VETFHCTECNSDYGWVLAYTENNGTGICSYCVGMYPDNITKCPGGSGKRKDLIVVKEEK
jgi:hypothetical protein